jgi:hypothetical protein
MTLRASHSSQMVDQASSPVDPANEHLTWGFRLASVPGLPCSNEGQLVEIEWFVDVKVDLPLKQTYT